MESFITPLVTVLMGLIGVAIVAALVSNKANTTGVINAGGNAFSNALNVALSPVNGFGAYGQYSLR